MPKIDLELRKKITTEIPEILKCFQCGTCVSSCPAEYYGKGYSPRRKILAASYGDPALFTDELWKCLTCHACNERCPQEVNPYDVLVKLKNYALKQGLADKAKTQAEQMVKKTGRVLRVTKRTQQEREKLGLPPLSPIEELQELVNDE